MIPSKEENPNGLHQKYLVAKSDGTMVSGAEYFVLRLDENADPAHREACRNAVLEYAKCIESSLPHLADDLRNRYKEV